MRDDYQLLPVGKDEDEKVTDPLVVKLVKYGFLPLWAIGAMCYIYQRFPNFGF